MIYLIGNEFEKKKGKIKTEFEWLGIQLWALLIDEYLKIYPNGNQWTDLRLIDYKHLIHLINILRM